MIRPFRTSLTRAGLTLLAVGIATSAFADAGPRWSDAQLVALSEAILTGRVVSVAPAWDMTSGSIYTYVTIDVGEVLKGWIPDRQIVVKQLGGVVDGIGLSISGQATFSPGEEALLFLEVRPRDQSLYTSALWQGKWSVERDGTGAQVASQHDPDSMRRSAAATARRGFGEFVNRLRTLSGDGSRLPGGTRFNTLPAEAPAAGPRQAGLAFTLLGPARWHEADTATPVRVDIQAGGQPGLPGNGAAEIPTAMALWNGSGSSMSLGSGVTRSPRCFTAFEGDGRISITFMDPCNEISNGGGTIAIGGGWYNETDTRTVNGTVFSKLIQGTIVNNDSSLAQSFLTRSRCFQDIITHELGHTIGLGHSGTSEAVMFPSVDTSCQSAVSAPAFQEVTGGLGADDISGIRFIYPGAGGPIPGGAPGKPAITATVNGTTVVLSWTAGSGAPPASYVLQAGTATNASNVFNQNVGNLTGVSATATPGTYFVRIIAVNAGGSTTSDEITIPVGGGGGPCTVPGTPVVAPPIKSGLNVMLSWTAAAGATSYVLQADLGGVTVFNQNVGNTTTINATAVPGTFDVRVIGVNACGPGPAATLTVTVP